ncbi:hypothetical protein TW95_gp0198 [Pandoravirus inopinatum]|uniref:Uncharacterized protein n=1 Tax=Pandoravirus inopinatum TaxID=1605721 RepID=A0A0B5JBJ3_9VIRU|nr:hypothetical protein TW95_gp0198 [Pandoravirus inopinatum]AJF96932.1 hypothetical protein [Pandoravirus inopinatum]
MKKIPAQDAWAARLMSRQPQCIRNEGDNEMQQESIARQGRLIKGVSANGNIGAFLASLSLFVFGALGILGGGWNKGVARATWSAAMGTRLHVVRVARPFGASIVGHLDVKAPTDICSPSSFFLRLNSRATPRGRRGRSLDNNAAGARAPRHRQEKKGSNKKGNQQSDMNTGGINRDQPAAPDLDALLARYQRAPLDAIERLIITAVSDDDVNEAANAIASLCRITGEDDPHACGALSNTVINAATASDDGGRNDIETALTILCANLLGLDAVCAVQRDPETWTRRYPALAARRTPTPLQTLVDVAFALRRIHAARRCALYALYTSVAALGSVSHPLPPYSAVSLRDLERWARRWQTGGAGTEPAVPPLPLVGPIGEMGPARERMFPVIADVTEAMPMTHNDIVALAYTEGPASLYGRLAETRGQVATSLANAVSRELASRLATAVLATESSAAVPRACLDSAINIFLVYPGTRPAVARHFRTDPNDKIDLGVLLRLPSEKAEEDEWGSLQ